jgi:HlyD family secretion protein
LVLGDNPRPLPGKVVGRIDPDRCELEFATELPAAKVGDKVGGLITTSELKDVVFFGRPALSRPNTTSIIFVLESDSQARRVTVQYGAMSGPYIQILNGITPGDKVIVTDMSKWANFPTVRLE